MIEIGNNVTLGSHSMIFAHSNPSANLFLKLGDYPRKTGKIIDLSPTWEKIDNILS